MCLQWNLNLVEKQTKEVLEPLAGGCVLTINLLISVTGLAQALPDFQSHFVHHGSSCAFQLPLQSSLQELLLQTPLASPWL